MNMPSYTTDETLRSIRDKLPATERTALLERAERRTVVGATFLSHSSADTELLPAVITILEGHGGKVYVDKKDPTLPPYTSPETARALRQRIVQARKFMLFATNRSKDSRWVPWELGIADGVKDGAQVAVFPSVETAVDTNWTEREYLGVYGRIVWGPLQGKAESLWMVWDRHKNTAQPLGDWLRA